MCETCVNAFIEKQLNSVKLEEYDLESYIQVSFLRDNTTLVSSEIANAVNRGRDNAIKSIDGVNIAFAQWSAILDDAVCDFCGERDGQIISVDSPEYDSCQPPAHGNCRCIYVYITSEERTGEGKEIEEDWTPVKEEDKLHFRVFEIENAKDLDSLAELYAKKDVRLLELIYNSEEKYLKSMDAELDEIEMLYGKDAADKFDIINEIVTDKVSKGLNFQLIVRNLKKYGLSEKEIQEIVKRQVG